VVQQRLRNERQAIQRPSACTQEHELDGYAKSAISAKSLGDCLRVVRQQAEKPVDIKLGQCPGQLVGADESEVVAGP
jgi:hypothetical protein